MCQHCPRHQDTVVHDTEKSCPHRTDTFVDLGGSVPCMHSKWRGCEEQCFFGGITGRPEDMSEDQRGHQEMRRK